MNVHSTITAGPEKTTNYKMSKPPRFKEKEKKQVFNGECVVLEKGGHKSRYCRNIHKKKKVSSAL